MSKSKCAKHTMLGPLFEVEMSKKCTLLWREAHFEVKSAKKTEGFGALLNVQMSFRVAGAWGLQFCQKWAKHSKTWGFCSISKNDSRRGNLKKIYAFSVAGAIQETSSSELLGGPGADFLREVALWSIRSSGLDDFAWHVQHFRQMEWQNRKTHWYEAVCSASQLSMFEGSLAELLRFWCCQLQKMRKSRKLSLLLTLSNSKNEEVLQNCCVFDVAKFKNWGSLAE